MKTLIFAITVTVGVLTLQVSTRAQRLEALQYTTGGIAVLECDWYKNPPPPIWYCHSCFDDHSPCSESGLLLRFDSNQPRSCHPGANLTKEDASPDFVYRVRLRNAGQKTIRAIEWDYIFIDRATQAEVARNHFQSEQKVRPGKRKTLMEYSNSPPMKVISVRTLSQPESDRFIEEVMIKRVTYTDGSVWEPLHNQQP